MRTRRDLLVTGAVLLTGHAAGETIRRVLPWAPYAGEPPQRERAGAWRFFSAEEGAAIEAMVDRLIPADELSPGGRDAGCAIFIDRQLAGPFGQFAGYYLSPPFADGLAGQGMQSDVTPAARYRKSLAAIADHCRQAYAGRVFGGIAAAEQDKLLRAMEKNVLAPDGTQGFFALLLANTMEGFFADPTYGGNKDMVGWRMLGFPGARYDQREWVGKHDQKYDLPPVAIIGAPDWQDHA